MAKKSGKGQTVKAMRSGPSAWVWVLIGVLAAAVLVYAALGIGHKNPTGSATTSGTLHNPKLPRSGFTWAYRAYALKTGRPAHLVRGSRITIVMLMASWCKYCAYDDRYAWPVITHTPGLAIDIVDVSNLSGIGNPGPKEPAFSGQDNAGPAVGANGMLNTMARYVQKFHLTYSNVHVYADPGGLAYWNIAYFPTILVLNSHGQLVERAVGGITIAQAKSLVQKALRQG